MNRKIMFIAIDGITWTILDPLIKENRLPNIKKLIDSGVSTKLISQEPLLTPIIWTSIFSGKKAKKHGITSFFDLYSDVKCLRIWDILHFEKDYSIGLFKVPVTSPPPTNLKGFIVPAENILGQKETVPSEYRFIEEILHGKVHWKPKNLKEKIAKYSSELYSSIQSFKYGLKISTVFEFWIYLFWRKILGRTQNTKNVFWRTFLKRKIYSESFNNLMSDFNTDFSAVYIAEADHFGHLFWKEYSDKYELKLSDDIQYSDAIYQIHERIDKEIGQIISKCPDDTTFVLMSDHGMCKIEDNQYDIDYVKLLSVLEIDDKVEKWKQPSTLYIWGKRDKNFNLSDVKNIFEEFVYSPSGDCVFSIENNDSNGLTLRMINQVNYNSKILNKKNGEVYNFSDFFRKYNSISGNHHMEGVFVMSGPNIKENSTTDDGIGILDIVPTLLYDLKMKIPNDIDGDIKVEFFNESFIKNNKIEYIDTYEKFSSEFGNNKEISEEDYEIMKKQLIALGYMNE